jgi:uncharacterized caspase-like protein
MRLSSIAFYLFASVFLAVSGGVSAKTAALVVGNNDYAHLPKLSVAVADAQSHCDHLKDVRKFDTVACHFNVTKSEMDRAVLGFLSQLEAGDTAMVVFSGHGVQLNPADPSTVFLLPTDLNSNDIPQGSEEYTLRQYSTQFNDLRRAIRSRNVRLSVYVLDNCRDNPLNAGSATRGLALVAGMGAVPADRGEFIFFSASEGEVAIDRLSDGDNNSPFTSAFLKSFQPNVPLVTVANIVEREVIKNTGALAANPQRPRYDDNVEGPGCIEGIGECASDRRASGVDAEIASALASSDFNALQQVMPKATGNARLPEVIAALEIHRSIDAQQTLLELDKLKPMYNRMSGHPRREEIRELIRRAILFNSCMELQRFGWPCRTNDAIAVAPTPELDTAALKPVQKEDEPVAPNASAFETLSAGIDLGTLGAFFLPLEKVQEALKSAGYYNGRIDGLEGPGTARAVKAWRDDVGSSGTEKELGPIELLVLLQQVAEDSPPSLALLGLFHAQGIGFGKDVDEGREMLQRAAKRGFSDAKNWLKQLEEL